MKKTIALLLCVALGMVATAQTNNAKKLIEECQRLHSDGEYTTALSLLEGIDAASLDADARQEYKLLKAVNTFECNPVEGRAQILDYLALYPSTAKNNLLNCYIAESYYHSGDFEQACEWFANCDLKRLTRRQRDEATLYYALSLMNSGKEGAAENLLRNLSLTSKAFAVDATFHLAVINYNRNELDAAYEGFRSIELEDKYYLDIPYYFAGISLKQGNVQRAMDIATNFINDHGATQQGIRTRQVLGAAHFALGNYEDAAGSLAIYVNNYRSPQRIAFYQLGVSLFMQENYDEALRMLNICAEGDDAIAQNAIFHIGLIQLALGNDDNARLALERASNMTHDNNVREEALYNYALCMHQSRYSPFAESVKAFERFLNDYPHSRHADRVGEYLVEVYTNTRNYDVAMQSINKIKEPSDKILGAKQNMLYRLGVQEFINGNMDGAIDYFDQSLELARHSKDIKGQALYWKGEALYRKGNMPAARKCYRQALAVDEAGNRQAMYGLGYTYFNERKYDAARSEFEQYVKAFDRGHYDLVSDCYNRIADCYYYQRQFDTAEGFYSKAANTYRKNADYSLYRLAQIQGLKNNRYENISTLQALVAGYPNSIYAEQALYELGRSYVKQEQYLDALETYNKLIANFPQGDFTRRALAERAMVYNVVGNKEASIAAYKEIISLYPDSEEAQLALQDLKSVYVDMGRIDLFSEYVASAGVGQKIDSDEMETLTYMAAERAYGRNDVDEALVAFDNYLGSYPEGAFRINCYYYKGLINYNKGAHNQALDNFNKVLSFSNNKFTEEAMVLAAGIYYSRKEYASSTKLYEQIASRSHNSERRKEAYINLLRTAVEQGNSNKTINYATKLLGSVNISPALEREALFARAKAYIAKENLDKAIDDLDRLAEDTRTREGAEAKFLVAQILFNDGSYGFCEDEIKNFIEVGTPHTYWMARSFVLLADLYIAQDRFIEAKQYLLSLQNNYEGDDDIADMITERLATLSANNK